MRFVFICVLLTGMVLCRTIPNFAQSKQDVYASINDQRTQAGLKKLEVDESLARSAQSWSLFMPYGGKHNMNFIKRRKLFKSQQAREKIGGSEALSWSGDPVKNWLSSYTHRNILLGSQARRMGLGFHRGKWVLRTLTY